MCLEIKSAGGRKRAASSKMRHTNLDELDSSKSQNMVSNLPLLFAGGYPTSLERITEKQLEKFIPFMVQCSLGYIQVNPRADYSEPEWWPENLKFLHPFKKPGDFQGDWHAKMKELVVICYSFHKSVFLLRFCDDLASYDQASLRFINNYNSTTSLYHRTTNKLLVTFRNENMLYDQPAPSRKSLLPKSPSAQIPIEPATQQMVEPALFDIYLCDNCDAELYSLEACKEHEKTCGEPDDDDSDVDDRDDDAVIICSDEESAFPLPISKKPLDQPEFLLGFGLYHVNIPTSTISRVTAAASSGNISLFEAFGSPEKLRRLPRRSRAVMPAIGKCHTIPISSPCGQLLLRQTKSTISHDQQMDRLDRMERFCHAPAIPDGSSRPKFWMRGRQGIMAPPITFKGHDQRHPHFHVYKHPRRQLSTKKRHQQFLFLNSLLLKACRPVSVKLKRLSDTDVEILKTKVRQAAQRMSFAKAERKPRVVEFIDLVSSDEEGAATEESREQRSAKRPKLAPTTEEIPSIDLDSDTETENNNQQTTKDTTAAVTAAVTTTTTTTVVERQLDFVPLPVASQPQQPLRPVFLFSNINNLFQATSATAAVTPAAQPSSAATNSATSVFFNNQENLVQQSKTSSIAEWLNSANVTLKERKNGSTTAAPLQTSPGNGLRRVPGLVNITTTTIRHTITAIDK